MSTRSIIAKQQGDTWAGRYAHWDGYPSNQAACIWHIVKRDGIQKAVTTLVDENYYWSNLNPFQEEGKVPDYTDDSRFFPVVGYGIAGNENQSDPDEWYTPENYKDSWCDYVYVIAPAGLMVIRIYDDAVLGFFRWDEDEPDWVQVQRTPSRKTEDLEEVAQ